MARHKVHVTHEIAAPAQAVWAVAGAFCRPWHPWLEWVSAEDGGQVRHFKVKGEAGEYRERILMRDDGAFTLRYEHLQGIAGALFYQAEICVEPAGETCRLHWRAEIEAAEPRGAEIAQGTRQVFEAGAAHLAACFQNREIQIKTAIGEIGVTAMGVAHAPLVLFLHGIGGNRSNWFQQLQALAPEHLAVAMDFRGYGSSSLGTAQSSVDDHCADILRVMKHFKARKMVLVGLSLGAWIATSFAMRRGDTLAGLVLAGGCTGMSEAPIGEREAFLAARQKPLDAGLTPADFAPQVVDVIAGPEAGAEVRDALRRSMAAIPAATYRDAVYCFTHPPEVFDFSKLACPVMLVTGEYDRLASPQEIGSVAKRMTAAGVDATFTVIPKAGHVCNLERPAAFNAALMDFLRHDG